MGISLAKGLEVLAFLRYLHQGIQLRLTSFSLMEKLLIATRDLLRDEKE